MSIEQEKTVRSYLSKHVGRWQSMPYEWFDLSPEALDDFNIVDVPEDVVAAYEATRSNPEDRARDAGDYGQHRSSEEVMLESIQRRRALGLPIVAEFANLDKWPEKDREEYEEYRRTVFAFAAQLDSTAA